MDYRDQLKPDDDETFERALANVPWYALQIPFFLAIGVVVVTIVIVLSEQQ